jgi:hypothetical protein
MYLSITFLSKIFILLINNGTKNEKYISDIKQPVSFVQCGWA